MQTTAAAGVSRRLGRLFNPESKHTVIVAMDHSFGGVQSGLERLDVAVERILEGAPDGIIMTPGTATQFGSLLSGRGAPALVLSLDFVLFHAYPGHAQAVEEQGLAASVETAARLGADAVKVLMIFGREDPTVQLRNFEYVARTAEACQHWGMPLIVEPTTWGHEIPSEARRAPHLIRDISRIAFEFGANVVKVAYTGEAETFRPVVDSCPVPVLILGGARNTEEASLLRQVQGAMTAGAAGVVFGRNIWGHPRPEVMIRALRLVVHQGDLAGALDFIKGDMGS